MSKTVDLGPVSAYALAVKHGYVGTEAEWVAEMEAKRLEAVNAAASAQESATAAASSRSSAESSATSASGSATIAETNAKASKSYAVGGTGSRAGEDTDNAKYYYEKAKNTEVGKVSEKVAGLSNDIGVLSARLDNIASLPEGSTTADAELMDIRVGSDGRTYNTAGEAVREQVGELKGDLSELYNVSEYGNFYNDATKLVGKDINSSSGALKDDSRYNISDKIVMDFSRRIIVVNSSYGYAYCYDENDNYLGRYDTTDTTDTALDKYPNTKYIRIGMKVTDENVMVVYYSLNGVVFEEYNPIGRFIDSKKDNTVIRVLTYNVGAFTGVEADGEHTIETALAYRKLIAEIGANIACYQSDKWSFNGEDPKDYVFGNSLYCVEENGYDYNQHYISSDYPIGRNGRITYANPSNIQTHKLFSYAYVKVNGIPIFVANVHFDWKDKNDRKRQMEQVLDVVKYHDNVIICGDFNPADFLNGVKQSDNLTFEEDLAYFTAKGFSCANGIGYFGNINTFADVTEIPGAWDNILVKGRLKIKNANRHEAKWLNDHYPFYADIVVY